MGGLVLLAAYLCRYLPETSNRPLPGTLVDVMESYADVLKSIVLLTSSMPGGGGPPQSKTMKMSAVAAGTEHARRISTQMASNFISRNGSVDEEEGKYQLPFQIRKL